MTVCPRLCRAAQLCKNDWYRLSRALEIARATDALRAEAAASSSEGGAGAEAAAGAAGAVAAFTGERARRGEAAGFDVRCFFLVGERQQICTRIDRRCE
jgi:tRNA A37 N6-isopentenylltransferase MiaA